MKIYHQVQILACVIVILLSVGCSYVPKEIPTGQWSGQGTWVDYEAITNQKESLVLKDRSKDKAYDTSLKISKRSICGYEALVFEICSKRGELFNFKGKETNLEFALIEIKTLDNGSTLYAVAGDIPHSDNDAAREEFTKAVSLASAICVRKDNAIILQLWYSPGETKGCFSDTIIFEGSGVRKIGHFLETKPLKTNDQTSKQKLMEVYWVEELHRDG